MMVAKDIRSDDIINGLGAGISVLDRNMRVVWVNQLMAEWFGSIDTLCGKYCYYAYKGKRKVCSRCPTVQVFKTGKPHSSVSIVHGKNGQVRHFFLAVSPIRNKDDEVVFAVELVQDISDRISRQRQTRVASGKLKRMLTHFSRVNKRLHSNMRKLKTIAGHMSAFKSQLQKRYHKKINELGQIKVELENIFKVNHAVLPMQITTESRMLYNPELKGVYMFVPGTMAMILVLISALLTSVSIVREKEMGTMEILLVSPVLS